MAVGNNLFSIKFITFANLKHVYQEVVGKNQILRIQQNIRIDFSCFNIVRNLNALFYFVYVPIGGRPFPRWQNLWNSSSGSIFFFLYVTRQALRSHVCVSG